MGFCLLLVVVCIYVCHSVYVEIIEDMGKKHLLQGSRWTGEGKYSQNINWSLGFLRDRFLDPSSSPHTLHHWIPSYKHMVSHTIAICWWHTALSLVSTKLSNGSCMDLRLPGGHLSMDERTSPTAQPGKDWASCLPCHSNSTAWFHHPARFFYNYPIKFSQKSGCNFRWPTDFQDHIAKTARSCRFALHNIRKIRPFLTQHAAQLLVQALVISRLDYCNAILAGLPSCTIQPLQMIQNAAAWLVFSELKRAHHTSHLSLSPCTDSRLQLASSSRHWCLHIEQPQAQHPPTSTHLWQSASPQEVWDLCHHREAQNPSPERFHSPFLAGGMNFPAPSGMLNPWQFSSDTWKLISSVFTWSLKKKNFTLVPLTSHCLARICSEQWVEICITSTSCVCLPLYNVSLIVFLNCKSLWIKASAKWINVNAQVSL